MDKSHLSPNAVPPPPPPQQQQQQPSQPPQPHRPRAVSLGSGKPSMNPLTEPHRSPRKLVLCFDGTGNKFHGDDSDSNILKIFRCLDRTAGDQYHYYQPGRWSVRPRWPKEKLETWLTFASSPPSPLQIGTYVVSQSLTHTSAVARLRSWYAKAKDSAIGSSFDQHVVGGYRFLMRFYSPGDEIYFFGFSRGAYVARFLAEMLDYVGLLSHGNEEMVVFAWKAFSRWQARRTDESPAGVARKNEMFRFMKGFRETFSRPVKRIRFLGLFDTVNSVPRFETAWMQRSKFPYTARSSAKVIRHCVSIDERRAKFRQDLIYQNAENKKKSSSKRRSNGIGHHLHHRDRHDDDETKDNNKNNNHDEDEDPTGRHERYRSRRAAISPATQPQQQQSRASADQAGSGDATARGRRETLGPPSPPPAETTFRPHSRSKSRGGADGGGRLSADGDMSQASHAEFEYESDSDDDGQDIDEVWFAGGHGDVGGGWELIPDSKSASHVPLAYMIREAQKAGLPFDPEKLEEMGCAPTPWTCTAPRQRAQQQEQQLGGGEIQINISSPSPQALSPAATGDAADWSHFRQVQESRQRSLPEPANGDADEKRAGHRDEDADEKRAGHREENNGGEDEDTEGAHHPFHALLHKAHVARIHDSLEFGSGLTWGQVLSWKMMEYLPFRRMDLQTDGSWKPIRWPLPCGETRDIPHTARVHGSVIRRMQTDAAYRPGNLIIGGGGRGLRSAPAHYGMGAWECVAEPGDPVGEIWVKHAGAPDES